MKNFPNQASDFTRLRATLSTIDELVRTGHDVSSDDVLGYELARRRHYTFRSFNYSAADAATALETRIRSERQKPPSNQGARTNAREMRRTLLALNWLDAQFNLTPEGQELLKSAPGSLQERQMLADALWKLEITDTTGTSHPVRILLRLLSVAPSRHRDGLELVLEARDDSPEELARMIELFKMAQEDRYAELQSRGVTVTQIRNAVKIFPSLARTAGMIVEDESGIFSLSPEGQAIIDLPDIGSRPVSTTPQGRSRHHHPVTAATVAKRTGGVLPANLSREDRQRAQALLAERTDRHQELVRTTASLIGAPGSLFENPVAYDLLWVPEDESVPLVLLEMKTLDNDARAQTRLAVAQLSWYHFFDVSPDWETRSVIEVAVFDGDPNGDARRYLEHEGVAALVVTASGDWQQITDVEPQLPAILGLPEASSARSRHSPA